MTATLVKYEPRFSIIIPAHNEEERIGKTLVEFAEAFSDSEIIIVLNGCTDATADVVARRRHGYDNIFVIDIADAVGKGGAVRAGFILARAQVVGYVDADGSTSAAEMRRLCEAVGENDGVIGSRWLPESTVGQKQSLRRRVASRCFNLIVRVLFGLKYRDTQCGAKVFRKDALESIVRQIETSNLAFDVDLLFAMKRAGRNVVEVPTVWVDTLGSKIKLVSASLRMFAALLRLRMRHSFLTLVVPVFDRFFPTKPLNLQDGLRIAVLNWRDPKHPQAGGAETYLFEQAKRWVQWGNHVDWLTAGFPGGAPRDEIDGVKVRRVGNAVSVYALLPWVYVREYRNSFDVVLDSENGISFFTPLFSLKPKICIVYHVHREVFRKHLPAWIAYPLIWCEEKLIPLLYRRVRFVTISEDTRDEMERIGMSRHIGIVRCGVDSALRPGTKSAVPTVVYLGRLKPYKRVNLLIGAFARVREAFPNAELHVVGTGDARPALEEQVARLGLESNVTFEGFVDEERKRAILQRAWVSVSPSEMEGWGISVIESNACGTPAVAFAVPGLSEAIVDGESGLLVPEGGDLAPAIVSILGDAAYRAALESGAIERARQFSWSEAAREMLLEMMRAIVGGEFNTVEIDDNWSLVSSPEGAGSFKLMDSRSLRGTA